MPRISKRRDVTSKIIDLDLSCGKTGCRCRGHKGDIKLCWYLLVWYGRLAQIPCTVIRINEKRASYSLYLVHRQRSRKKNNLFVEHSFFKGVG